MAERRVVHVRVDAALEDGRVVGRLGRARLGGLGQLHVEEVGMWPR